MDNFSPGLKAELTRAESPPVNQISGEHSSEVQLPEGQFPKGQFPKGQRGMVLEIQRMSTEDGPGLRTTVFMKGCPLSCQWCHNPESISPKPQLVWQETGCIGCLICVETCEHGALSSGPEGMMINRDLCCGCGKCADQCPSLSMTLLGKEWSPQDLVNELIKDQAYFKTSKGGVTLSGGEATLQHAFVHQVLKGLQACGIHTALDTCGMSSTKILKKMLRWTDVLLFDVKEMDDLRHREFTGSSNGRILKNLKQLPELLRETRTQLWIRTPIIPGATDREENIEAIGAFITDHLEGQVIRWELCAFNPLGQDKYTRLGKTWAYENTGTMEKSRMDSLYRIAVESGVDKTIVVQSGSVSQLIKEEK